MAAMMLMQSMTPHIKTTPHFFKTWLSLSRYINACTHARMHAHTHFLRKQFRKTDGCAPDLKKLKHVYELTNNFLYGTQWKIQHG